MTIRFTYGGCPTHCERLTKPSTQQRWNHETREYDDEEGFEEVMEEVEADRAFWQTRVDRFTGESGREAKADINDYHMMGHWTDEEKSEQDEDAPSHKPGSPSAYSSSNWEIGTLCRIYLKGVHIGCVIKHTCNWRGTGNRWVGYRLDANGVYRQWVRRSHDRESTVAAMARCEAKPYDEETEQQINFDGTPSLNYYDKPIYHDLTLAEVWQAAQGGLAKASEQRRRKELATAAIVNGVVIIGLRN